MFSFMVELSRPFIGQGNAASFAFAAVDETVVLQRLEMMVNSRGADVATVGDLTNSWRDMMFLDIRLDEGIDTLGRGLLHGCPFPHVTEIKRVDIHNMPIRTVGL